MASEATESIGVDDPPPNSFTIGDLLRFIRRQWVCVLLIPVAAGVLVFINYALLVPPTFEASATLIVIPPRFSSDLKPIILSIQAYQSLLETDAGVAETKRRLQQHHELGINAPLRRDVELASRLSLSRRPEDPSPAPMLELIGRGRTPRLAAAIANTWAEVFLEQTKALFAGTRSNSAQFIGSQYPLAHDRLTKLD